MPKRNLLNKHICIFLVSVIIVMTTLRARMFIMAFDAAVATLPQHIPLPNSTSAVLVIHIAF